jgi:hypothetical protein
MGEYYGLFTSNQLNKLNSLVKMDSVTLNFSRCTKQTEKQELFSKKKFFVTYYRASKLKCLSLARLSSLLKLLWVRPEPTLEGST